MFRHVSVFTLRPEVTEQERASMRHALEAVGATCPLVVASEVGEALPSMAPAPKDGPVFGDLIQIVDFATRDDLDAYPASEAHEGLRCATDHLIAGVCAIDYEI